jgi:hypothetical protein
MEIRFVSITAFRTALDALLKVKRGVYEGVPEEICKAFQNVGIEQIRANRDMILMDNESITVKLRLPDKRQRLSKAHQVVVHDITDNLKEMKPEEESQTDR